MMPTPNILLLMCDDLGFGDTGFNGNTAIHTPHLDRLRQQGARFTRFYSGGPVCSPTRGTCLTGRHYARYGITHANAGRLPAQEITLARILKEKGYTTGHFGKWHLGTLDPDYSGKPNRDPAANYAPPWERDYDESFATEYAVPTWDPGRHFTDKTYERSDSPWQSPYYENGVRVDEMLLGCDSKLIADRTIAFLRSAVGEKKPFFSTIWFHAPHAPVEAGPEYLRMYQDHDNDEAHYYGVVTAMDEQVGRIMSALDDLAVTDDTVVWFCSDNGPEGSEDLGTNGRYRGVTGGLRGRKRSLYNGGVGVPALVRWPGTVPAGSEYGMPCSTLDYFPTIAELVGYTMPDARGIDGISLLALLDGRMTERPQPIPFRFVEKQRAMFGSPTFGMIDNDLKFLTNFSDDHAEDAVFDLRTDPYEKANVIESHRAFADTTRDNLRNLLAEFERSHYGGDYGDQSYRPTTPFQGIGQSWSDA
jgi:arylsulfatase A-like enzyme